MLVILWLSTILLMIGFPLNHLNTKLGVQGAFVCEIGGRSVINASGIVFRMPVSYAYLESMYLFSISFAKKSRATGTSFPSRLAM